VDDMKKPTLEAFNCTRLWIHKRIYSWSKTR